MRIIQILESVSVGGMGTGSVATAPSKAGKMIRRQKPTDNALDSGKLFQETNAAEGVAETVPMQYAQKVLNHYGADYFKTTHDTLYFSKYRKQFSIDRIRDDDSASAGSVSLSDLNNIVRKLRGMRVPLSPFGEGVAEAGVEENKKGVRAVKHTVKPRNFVAKNAVQSGAGAHKDKKKAQKQGDTKHKNKEPAYESRLWAALDRRIIK